MNAILAEFANFKRIPSRKVCQIILEAPEENMRQIFDTLGYPNSSDSIWVGVARLQEPEDDRTQAP